VLPQFAPAVHVLTGVDALPVLNNYFSPPVAPSRMVAATSSVQAGVLRELNRPRMSGFSLVTFDATGDYDP
jgi:hypothetical protein